MDIPPSVLLVMGVSGSGKTTVAALLAGRLGWEFVDADDFHPAANLRKMQGGTPLDDVDRAPWLAAMAGWIGATLATGQCGVLACSALKRAYRARLIGGRRSVRLVFLEGDEPLIGARQAARHDHFMPASLVHSQFETLEPPGADERPLVVSVAPAAAAIAATVTARLGLPTLACPPPAAAGDAR